MSYPVNYGPYLPPTYPGYAPMPMPPQMPGYPAPTMAPDRYMPTYPAYGPAAMPLYGPQPSMPAPDGLSSLMGALSSLLSGIFGWFRKKAPAPVVAPTPPANLQLPDRSTLSDEAFVTSLYAQLLGRLPDPEGFAAHMNGLRQGLPRADLYRSFLESSEYRGRQQAALMPPAAPSAPASVPGPQLPPNALPGLATVAVKPEYGAIAIDTSSPDAAVLSAAKWVRQNCPQFFDKGDDRPTAKEMMGTVIGLLRAHGVPATRVVNYPNQPVGDPGRYGKDALVVNGTIFDCYSSWGDPNAGNPQALNAGPYGDRPAE